MAKDRNPCQHGCGRLKRRGGNICEWCWLADQPVEIQIRRADARLKLAQEAFGFKMRERLPDGERSIVDAAKWVSCCQDFIPLDYVVGPRCKGHQAKLDHAGHLARTYSLTRDEYEKLLAWQGGRCYICRQLPRTKRLAVDHDHRCCPGPVSCGQCVRGLLCANNEWGCNMLYGTLERKDNILEIAVRIWEFGHKPPMARLRDGEPTPFQPRPAKRSAYFPETQVTPTPGGPASG